MTWSDVPEERCEIIEELFAQRFGHLQPDFDSDDAEVFISIRHARGEPVQGAALERLAADRGQAVAYLHLLQGLSDKELRAVWHDVQCEEGDSRWSHSPGPNFEAFGRQATWTVQEAAALLLGKDPRTIEKLTGSLYENTPSLVTYRELITDIERGAQEFSLGPPTSLSRLRVLQWAKNSGIPVSKEVSDGFCFEQVREHLPGNSGQTHSLKTLSKALLAIAVMKYEYDLKRQQPGTVAKLIRDDAADVGIEIHYDTIVKYLNRAREDLSASQGVAVEEYCEIRDKRKR
jgi:hypothetical protein